MSPSIPGDTSSKKQPFQWPGIALLVCAAVAQLLFVLRYSVDVPFWDQFDFAPLLKGASLQSLLAPHNEHRLLVPRLIFIPLAHLSRWNVQLEVLLNWAILQCSALLLFLLLKRHSGKQWMAVGGTFLFMVPQYFHNLLWGFQYCFQISICAVLALAWVLDRDELSWGRLLTAAFLCLAATFSLVNGLLAWFVFLPLIILAKGGKRKAVVWLAIALATTAVYLFCSRLQTSYQPLDPALHPRSFLRYFFTLISAGFMGAGRGFLEHHLRVHFAVGAFLVAAVAYGFVSGAFRVSKDRAPACLLVFILLSMATITWGRANFQGLLGAMTHRYREYTVLIPILAAAMFVASGKDTKAARLFLSLLLAGMALGTAWGWRTAILDARGWKELQLRNRQVLLTFEARSDRELELVYPYPGLLRERAALLKEMKYSIFRE